MENGAIAGGRVAVLSAVSGVAAIPITYSARHRHCAGFYEENPPGGRFHHWGVVSAARASVMYCVKFWRKVVAGTVSRSGASPGQSLWPNWMRMWFGFPSRAARKPGPQPPPSLALSWRVPTANSWKTWASPVTSVLPERIDSPPSMRKGKSLAERWAASASCFSGSPG